MVNYFFKRTTVQFFIVVLQEVFFNAFTTQKNGLVLKNLFITKSSYNCLQNNRIVKIGVKKVVKINVTYSLKILVIVLIIA